MRIEIDTTEFEMSHGKKPRGVGAWAFAYYRNADMADIFWINGSWGEARKEAIAAAKACNKSGMVRNRVFVCP